MSPCQLRSQFHSIAFPEFPFHMQAKYLLMISLLFQILQHTFKKICN